MSGYDSRYDRGSGGGYRERSPRRDRPPSAPRAGAPISAQAPSRDPYDPRDDGYGPDRGQASYARHAPYGADRASRRPRDAPYRDDGYGPTYPPAPRDDPRGGASAYGGYDRRPSRGYDDPPPRGGGGGGGGYARSGQPSSFGYDRGGGDAYRDDGYGAYPPRFDDRDRDHDRRDDRRRRGSSRERDDRRGAPPSRDPYGYDDHPGGGPPRDRYDDPRARGGGEYYHRDRADRDRSGGEVTENMEVPAEVAKMSIGSGGRAVKDLQDRTGAHVMIYKPQPGDDERLATRPVMIKGTPEAVDAAVAELTRRCRDYERKRRGGQGGHGGQGGGGGHGSYGPDRGLDAARRGGYPGRGVGPGGGEIFEERVDVAPENKGMIIGKGGARVARLEKETGCIVRSDKTEPFIVLRGTRRAIDEARQHVAAILSQLDLPPLPEKPPEGEPPAARVSIPGDAIGRVMGHAGGHIKRMQCETGCFMNWNKEAREMSLWGTAEVVAEGKRQLEAIIEDVKNERLGTHAGGDAGGDAAAGGGGDGGGGGAPRETANVPTRGMAGVIIGRGGATIKRLEAESGARLHVDDDDANVQITGDARAIETATRLVEDTIRRGLGGAGDGAGGYEAAAAPNAAPAAWTKDEGARAADEEGGGGGGGGGGAGDGETNNRAGDGEDAVDADAGAE